MKKIILHIMVALLTLGGGVVAYAQTDGTAAAPQSFMQKVRSLFENKKADTKAIKQEIQDVREKTVEQNASSTENKPEIKDLKEKTASSTEKIKNKMEEAKSKVAEQQKAGVEKRVENRFDKMTARYLATIEREKAIMAKVNSRIEKIKTAGGNTLTAEKLVLQAKTSLEEARTAETSLKTIVDNTAVSQGSEATTTAVSKEILTAMKKAGGEIEKYLQEAHKALEKAVASLKGSSQLQNATSTKEKTN